MVAGGSVEGEIRVPSASISGSVKGNIYSADNLELTKGAVVTGDVFYNLIEMAIGAEINGKLIHDEPHAAIPEDGSVASGAEGEADADQETGPVLGHQTG